MQAFYPQFGVLNFMQLTKDKIVTIARDKEDECMIPLTKVVVTNTESEKVVQYGQHNDKGQLVGLGRRIKISTNGQDIWEGQFKGNKQHGFGRWMIHRARGYGQKMGIWKQGKDVKMTDEQRGKLKKYLIMDKDQQDELKKHEEQDTVAAITDL